MATHESRSEKQHRFGKARITNNNAVFYYGMKYVVGIDEAGRGPLAGPVAVGAVSILNPTTVELRRASKNFFKSIKDSKKLSPGDRELWFALALEARKKDLLDFAVSLVSEKVIDRKGISY
ncbi:MAG: hypothetical protein Q8Q22_01935, partial [bacterium]|nr:hypothetical protein [bacterium]